MVPSQTLKDRWEQAKLDELLDGSSRVEFTLRFTLSHPGLSTTIVGTRNLAHLEANVRVAKAGPLAPHIVEEAKRRLAQVANEGAALPQR
jgi:aryl-alcohol dehydrogenase-like predicted oxidoreductase